MDGYVLPDKIVVAVDIVILAIGLDKLEVLLVELKNKPYDNMWALPGAVVGVNESLDDTAKRVLNDRVGDNKTQVEQLYCFGDVDRDIRGRSISVAYLALLSSREKIESRLSDNYLDIKWFEVDKLPEMAFDHKKIIKTTSEKLAYKLDEINIIRPLLPQKFTLSELQKVHEILLGKKIDKRNFVKKIKSSGMVLETKEKRVGGAFRPATLYQF